MAGMIANAASRGGRKSRESVSSKNSNRCVLRSGISLSRSADRCAFDDQNGGGGNRDSYMYSWVVWSVWLPFRRLDIAQILARLYLQVSWEAWGQDLTLKTGPI